MLSGVGSTEIADTLASNVAEVHQFLFGDTDYQVSGTVKGIDDEINDALSSGKYEEADETEKRMKNWKIRHLRKQIIQKQI